MSGRTRALLGGVALTLGALLLIPIVAADPPDRSTPVVVEPAAPLHAAASGPVCRAQDAGARAAAFHATLERLREQAAARWQGGPEEAGSERRVVVLNGRGYNYDVSDRAPNPAILELEAKLSR